MPYLPTKGVQPIKEGVIASCLFTKEDPTYYRRGSHTISPTRRPPTYSRRYLRRSKQPEGFKQMSEGVHLLYGGPLPFLPYPWGFQHNP